MDIPKYPNDRDYFLGEDQSIYQVLGYVHPEKSVYCLEKYKMLAEVDKNAIDFHWYSNLNNSYYERILTNYSSRSANENIHNNKFRKKSQIYGSDFIEYPKDKILRYLSPTDKLKEMRRDFYEKKLHFLEKKKPQENSALEISYILEDEFAIMGNDIGLTGSILWEGIHDGSDIDIIIYGLRNVKKFLDNVQRLPSLNQRIRKPSTSELFTFGNRFSQKTGLSLDDCVVYSSMKKYLLYYEKYFLSLAFCPKQSEISENPLATEKTEFINNENMETVTIRAEISNLEWSYFYPAVIDIKNIKINDSTANIGGFNPNICRIIIFERESSGYFSPGQNIEARGLVQKIINPPPKVLLSNALILSIMDEKDLNLHQLIIGTKENYGNEYIKNLDL